MTIAETLPRFYVQILNTSRSWLWFVKDLHFIGHLDSKGVSIGVGPRQFWYVFADYFDKIRDGRLKVKPEIFVEDTPVANNFSLLQTCKDKMGEDYYRYADFVDLRGICEDDKVVFGGDQIELDENLFRWKIIIRCKLSSNVDLKTVDGKEQIVLRNNKNLIQKSFEDCDGSEYAKDKGEITDNSGRIIRDSNNQSGVQQEQNVQAAEEKTNPAVQPNPTVELAKKVVL